MILISLAEFPVFFWNKMEPADLQFSVSPPLAPRLCVLQWPQSLLQIQLVNQLAVRLGNHGKSREILRFAGKIIELKGLFTLQCSITREKNRLVVEPALKNMLVIGDHHSKYGGK